MAIPQLDPATGRLPYVGDDRPYVASLAEIHQRYVRRISNAPRRAQIWRAFRLWHTLAQAELPGVRYWLSGSFLTNKTSPSDLDVILVLEPRHVRAFTPTASDSVRVLVSHLNVFAEQPAGAAAKLQPVGGLIDGFYCPGWIPEYTRIWQARWTTEFDKATHRPTVRPHHSGDHQDRALRLHRNLLGDLPVRHEPPPGSHEVRHEPDDTRTNVRRAQVTIGGPRAPRQPLDARWCPNIRDRPPSAGRIPCLRAAYGNDRGPPAPSSERASDLALHE